MPIEPNYAAIPDEMKAYHQWCVWRYEDRSGAKPTKVPYNPLTGALASVTAPATWCSYADAVRCVTALGTSYDGIGFVLSANDPYTFIDLDQTDKAEDTQRQLKVFQEFDSYSERSPSGNGLHIIVKGNIPQGRRRSSIELYSSERYMTMTGAVFHAKPIEQRQELLSMLWEQMGANNAAVIYDGNAPETESDDTIRQRALDAANGMKFRELLEGRWHNVYASQSEADFAFIDIIAFYTQSRDQILRIFRESPLGQRDKAKRVDYVTRMINRAFDNILPPVDIGQLSHATREVLAARPANKTKSMSGGTSDINGGTSDDENFVAKLREFWEPRAIEPPPGLMGEVARYIYASAPRPVVEVAIIASMGLMAGICGRSYNVSGTGLNIYALLLAMSGIGKEQINNGISSLMSAVAKTTPGGGSVPAALNFVGPAEIASGQALLKHLSDPNKRSFVSVVGEFGLKLQQLSSRNASSSETMLKRVLLDLYNKSGKNNVLGASAYAQKENNTAAIPSPAVSLIGESTPSTFFDALDENLIANGLLPRFIILAHKGKRPPRNKDHETITPPADLVAALATLVDYSLKMQRESRVIDVRYTPDAQDFLDRLDVLVDSLINATDADALRELWNRAHIKTLKLAALIAVGVNMSNPVITLEMAQWAYNVVSADIVPLAKKFSAGEIGKNSEENIQSREIMKACVNYVSSDFKKIINYHVPRAMHADLVIPQAYISRKCSSLAAFRQAKQGGTRAIHDMLKALCDTGDLQEVGKGQLMTKYKFTGRAYVLGQPELVLPRLQKDNEE